MKMHSRSVITISLSLVIGVGLIVLLLRASSVRWQEVFSRSLAVDPTSFVLFSLVFALNSFLSSQKWRMTDRVIRHGEGDPLPSSTAFGLTTSGVALGQFLPIQISMSVARTLGTLVYGRPFQRGTVATLFEQAFDFLAAVLMMAVAVCTQLVHGGSGVWLAFALAGAAVAVGSVGRLMKVLDWLTARLLSAKFYPARWRRTVAELRESGLFQANLARPLMLISLARFGGLVLMAREASVGLHLAIPVWRLAEAVPFGLLAAVAGITPGGLGVSEAAYTAVLSMSGLPLPLATQWAIGMRLLSFASAFVVAAFGCVLWVAGNAFRKSRDATHR